MKNYREIIEENRQLREKLAMMEKEIGWNPQLTILNNIDAIIYIADMQTYELLFTNAAFNKDFGEHTGGKCYKVIQGLDKPCEFCTNNKLLTKDGKPKEPYIWEVQNKKNKQWYQCHDQAIIWKNGGIARIEIANNITMRKNSEFKLHDKNRELFQLNAKLIKEKITSEIKSNELSQANIQLNMILKGARIGWWDWDITTGKEIYNDILPELLGYAIGEIEPHISWWKDKIHTQDLSYVRAGLEEHFAGKTEYYINEHRLMTKAGEWRWFLDYGQVIERDKEGNPLRMIGTLRDITHSKKSEEDIKNHLQKQKILLREVNHRVKNNLYSITSILHKEKDKFLKIDNTQQTDFIDDLLLRIDGLSAVHTQLSSTSWEPLRLKKLFENLANQLLKQKNRERNIIQIKDQANTMVDSEQAQQIAMVFIEIITNSIKYSQRTIDELKIEITITCDEKNIFLNIQDNGIGFKKAVMTETRKNIGVGFNLIFGIVKKSLGGTVIITNNSGALYKLTIKRNVIEG